MRGRRKRRKTRPGRRRPESLEWAKLYPELYPQVRSWFLARVANKQDADDLAEGVLTRSIRGVTPRDLKADLAIATANALARYQQRRARERDFLRKPLAEATGADDMRVCEPKDLSEEGESKEQREAVEKLPGTLPPAQAQLLRPRFLEGPRMAEVARRLGCSKEAAYQRFQWLIKRLRER